MVKIAIVEDEDLYADQLNEFINKRYEVIKALDSFGGKVRRFEFTNQGLETWQI